MWPACNNGITQFYPPPTHEPYLPLLPSRKASPPFGWYSLRLPTKGWPGWVDLGGWSHTKIDVPHWELNPDTVTHLNRPTWICIALCHVIGYTSKALRYGPRVQKGLHSFTCHPHMNHTCLYSPAVRRHRPLAGTHCAYPRRDGRAELVWLVAYRDECSAPRTEPGHSHPSEY